MSTFRRLSGLLALLLAVSVALSACRPASSPPASSTPHRTVPPEATVNVILKRPNVDAATNSGPSIRIGEVEIHAPGATVDGIRYDGNVLVGRAEQFARLDGQLVIMRKGPYRWVFGTLDNRRIVQDESGQWVLPMEQDVPLTLRMHAEALRSARAGVTDPEAIALLDQAIQAFADAADPAPWRDTLLLRPESGAAVFAALRRAQATLQALFGDPYQPSRLRDALGVPGQTAVGNAITDATFLAHILARAAYDEAEVARVPPEVLAGARAAEVAGGRARDQRRLEEAIQHYLLSWQIAVQVVPPGTAQATPAP